MILTWFAGLMTTYSIYTLFKQLNNDSMWADIGFYALSFILTLAFYLFLFFIAERTHTTVGCIVFLVVCLIILLSGIIVPIYMFINDLVKGENSRALVTGIHIAVYIVMSPLLSIMLIAFYSYGSRFLRRIAHG